MDQEFAICCALRDLETGEITSIRAAARTYNINHTTLCRRLSGQRPIRDANAKLQLLSPVQEDALVQWIQELQNQGETVTHKQLKEMAGTISKASGGRSHFGNNWSQRFLKRHPHIEINKGKPIATTRVVSPKSARSVKKRKSVAVEPDMESEVRQDDPFLAIASRLQNLIK